tara:strand:- start:339 stop:1019 length:681 start_codon:yes stop_codon:yes gene_type:complete
MKKKIYLFIILLFSTSTFAHTDHYKGIVKIEMDVFRNGKIIGYSNYFFDHVDKKMTVKNYTKLKVELFGVDVFSILSEAIEVYEDEKLINFKSNTLQNKKEKYVNLNYDDKEKKFIIDGSSYKGKADLDCVIGNWWNHKILKAKKQISPLSGSIKEQVVSFVKNETLIINGKSYSADHYRLKSKNENLPDDKKLNFDIWLGKKNNLILKVKYKKMGEWEYKLKDFK